MKMLGVTFHPRVFAERWKWRFSRIFFRPFDCLFCLVHRLPCRGGTTFLGYPVVRDRGTIRLGRDVVLCSRTSANSIGVPGPVRLTVYGGGRLEIGDRSGLSGTAISVFREVRIGSRVLVGSGCLIMDNDARPLDPALRASGANPASAPVCIEDDAFVGARSIVLKGVTIGRGAVIGAGSVVTKDVPPGVVAAGNPARVVGTVRS